MSTAGPVLELIAGSGGIVGVVAFTAVTLILRGDIAGGNVVKVCLFCSCCRKESVGAGVTFVAFSIAVRIVADMVGSGWSSGRCPGVTAVAAGGMSRFRIVAIGTAGSIHTVVMGQFPFFDDTLTAAGTDRTLMAIDTAL